MLPCMLHVDGGSGGSVEDVVREALGVLWISCIILSKRKKRRCSGRRLLPSGDMRKTEKKKDNLFPLLCLRERRQIESKV